MKCLRLPFLILTLASLIGCSILSGDDNTDAVNIRLYNASSYTYQNIRVVTPSDEVLFGDLNPGGFTDHWEFQTAYRYAFVELLIDGNTYTLQPIDYVGETPLKNGYYIYQIDANDSQDRFSKLSISLIEDQQ